MHVHVHGNKIARTGKDCGAANTRQVWGVGSVGWLKFDRFDQQIHGYFRVTAQTQPIRQRADLAPNLIGHMTFAGRLEKCACEPWVL